MPVVLITSVSPSGNLVTTKKFQDSKTSSNLFENNITDNNNITITTNNNDIDMTKSLINNGQNSSSMGNIEYITNFETFNERTYDDDKSSYPHYNNFTNHNINKIVTEKNANENLNFKNNANLISIHENSIYTTTSSSISSSSISSSFSSSFLSSSPESNVNNIINYLSMQHITTTSPNMINTVHLNQNIYDNNIIDNSTILGTKSNEIDRVINSDDKNRSQPCLRKQQSPSKIQRLKRTFSLSKKSDREVEELEQGEEEVINTSCDNRLSFFATATPPSTLKENYPFRPFTMSRDSVDVLDNSNNSSQHLNHSTYKKFSSSTITISTKKSTPCVCNDNIRKRVKSNSIHHCPILPSTISLTSLIDDSSSKDSSINCSSPTTTTVADMIIPESRESHDHPSKIKARNSMDDQTEFDIRRSWSHIEVRHLKGLFSRRNRHSSDVQRRNSYAYTNSQRANRQAATESEFKVLNHVHKLKKTNLVNEEDTPTTPTTPTTPMTPMTPTSSTSSTSSMSSTPTTPTSSTTSFTLSTTSDVEQSSQSSPKKFPVDLFALQADMEKEPDGITRSRQMRKFIISEIYSTEQSYLSHMKTLKKTFMDPCINASTSPPLINKDDIRIIFAHLDDLVKLSDKFVETIETSMDPCEVYDSKLGQVFLDFAEGFEVYKKYAENIQRSRQLLTKKVNQSVFYRRFVSAQRKKENIKLSLSDYLIMPIQRVARYALLLKDLKKYTVETHSDYNDLCKALDFMVSLAKECNNNIQDI